MLFPDELLLQLLLCINCFVGRAERGVREGVGGGEPEGHPEPQEDEGGGEGAPHREGW